MSFFVEVENKAVFLTSLSLCSQGAVGASFGGGLVFLVLGEGVVGWASCSQGRGVHDVRPGEG